MLTLILPVLFLVQDPTVGELIRSLNDDDIVVRRRAADELVVRGKTVEEAVWLALFRAESLEASLAAEEVLSRLGRLDRANRPMRELATGRKPV